MSHASVAAGRKPTSGSKGVLRVDKPVGPTSHDAVRVARRSLGEKRIGHTGTLDPFATGLLILLVGPATRLAGTLSPLQKRYEATVRLGVVTDSADRMGTVVRSHDGAERVSRDQVEPALNRQVGTIMQRPPRYSAKKIDGEAAHRRVRRGEDVSLASAEVTIFSATITRFEPPVLDIEVVCSTGTYIRSIARDLGETLGLGGHLTALRRTAIGPYTVEGALQWEALGDPTQAQAGLVPTNQGLAHLPHFAVTADDRELIRTGRAIVAPDLISEDLISEDLPVLAIYEDAVLSVGEIRQGQFHPKKVFPDGA